MIKNKGKLSDVGVLVDEWLNFDADIPVADHRYSLLDEEGNVIDYFKSANEYSPEKALEVFKTTFKNYEGITARKDY